VARQLNGQQQPRLGPRQRVDAQPRVGLWMPHQPVIIGVISLTVIGFLVVCAIWVATTVTGNQLPYHKKIPTTWVLARSSLSNILSADSSIVTRMFNHPYVYITEGLGSSDPVPPGWRSVPTVNFKSYAEFSAAVSKGAMPGWTKAVLYDPEAWSQTPHNEQVNVGYYMRQFCHLAHQEGWQAIMTPGTDLMNVYPKLPGETNAQAFVRYHIAGEAARYADVSETQSQALETDPRAYNWFLTQTRPQALAANSHDVFLGGLTANLLGTTASAEMMYHAAISVTSVVDGFFLNTSRNAPDPINAVQFLHRLTAHQRPVSGISQSLAGTSKVSESMPKTHSAECSIPATTPGLLPVRCGGELAAAQPFPADGVKPSESREA